MTGAILWSEIKSGKKPHALTHVPCRPEWRKDGMNDTFRPVVSRPDLITDYHLAIYNRWGQEIFETFAIDEAWDGSNASNGIYQWVIEFRNRMGKVSQLKGYLTVIK